MVLIINIIYIQISEPTGTLTTQDYGTISFNIGPTKTQKAIFVQ